MSLLLLALIPPLYLVYYVYRQDKIENEPVRLIIKVFFLGVLSVVPILIFEVLADGILSFFLEDTNSTLYILLDNILCVGLIEETGKYHAAKSIWKHPAFNYRFDAIVYTVTAALGFAAIENVLYVFENGFGVGIMRAVLSVPSHAIDGIFMGIYFGEAKYCEVHGDKKGKKRNLRKAIWIPTLTHGIYDALLSFEEEMYILIFLLFVIVVNIVALRRLKKHSREDAAFYLARDIE